MDTKQKNQNLSKKKIINSAIVLFASKGFDSTSTREICKHAGVNLSLISYYFKTKENLYTSIIESILNFGLKVLETEIKLAKNIDELSKDEKGELFYRLLEKYTTFLYSESVPNNFVILMIKEQTVSNSKFSTIYTEKIEIFYQALRKILASIMGKNENDKMIIFQISIIIGEILSFKFMDKATLTPLKQTYYTKEDNKIIKKIVLSHIKTNLKELGVNIE